MKLLSKKADKPGMSIQLEEKLNAIIAKVDALEQTYKQEKTKPPAEKITRFKDWAKFAGTFIVLACWSYENTQIKPEESLKQEQQYKRTDIGFIYSLEMQARFGLDYSLNLLSRDSSDSVKHMVNQYSYYYAVAINYHINATAWNMPKTEKYNKAWTDAADTLFYQSEDSINIFSRAGDYERQIIMAKQLDSVRSRLKEDAIVNNAEYWDIPKRIAKKKTTYFFWYWFGGVLVAVSVFPKLAFKKKDVTPST